MVVVAIAGASSGFGLTFLRTLVFECKRSHKFVLLSRSQQSQWAEHGIDVRQVDYTSHDSLVEALEGVHTVLSLVGGSMDAILNSQLALIAAAKEVGVKRFAPSEFTGAGGGYEAIDMFAPKRTVWEAAKESGLEVTRFECGIFMSIMATGTPKPPTVIGRREGSKTGEEEALAGLRPWNFVINMTAGTADFPLDGTAKIVFTDIRDIARFTIAALDLPSWPESLGMSGSMASFQDLVAIAEKIQGRKFLTKQNSLEDMETQASDPAKSFYNQCRIALSKGWGVVEPDLNKAFPDIKPVTLEEFAENWWSGVKLGEPCWVEDKLFIETNSKASF